MKPATPLTSDDIEHLLTVVRRHWPELDHYETGVFNLALNRIQQIAEKEGVAAITPPRLEGLREIVAGYVIPFAAASDLCLQHRLRELGESTAIEIIS